MADFVKDGLRDKERGGEGRGGEEVDLVEDDVGVDDHPV